MQDGINGQNVIGHLVLIQNKRTIDHRFKIKHSDTFFHYHYPAYLLLIFMATGV